MCFAAAGQRQIRDIRATADDSRRMIARSHFRLDCAFRAARRDAGRRPQAPERLRQAELQEHCEMHSASEPQHARQADVTYCFRKSRRCSQPRRTRLPGHQRRDFRYDTEVTDGLLRHSD